MIKKLLLITLLLLHTTYTLGLELVIGEEKVSPGIVFIFEGAIKDHIEPVSIHLKEQNTHVHIEARVNWDSKGIPEGAVKEGFIPYLHISSKIINEKTGQLTFIDLLPHINLIDNFHYARNITLPGAVDDTYTVIFNVHPPQELELSFHKDWIINHDKKLLEKQIFTYQNVNFEKIAKAKRK